MITRDTQKYNPHLISDVVIGGGGGGYNSFIFIKIVVEMSNAKKKVIGLDIFFPGSIVFEFRHLSMDDSHLGGYCDNYWLSFKRPLLNEIKTRNRF